MVEELAPVLAARDLAALVSDAEKPMAIGGFRTTQSARLLIIVQGLAELTQATPSLARQGYYEKWLPGDIERIRLTR